MINIATIQRTLIKNFYRHQIGVVRSKKTTAKNYAYDAKQYISFFSLEIDETLTHFEITKSMIHKFVAYRRELGRAESTIERQVHGLIAFWDFLHLQGLATEPIPYKKLGLNIKPIVNPTQPLSKNDNNRFMKGIFDELETIW